MDDVAYEESVRARAREKLDQPPLDAFEMLCRLIKLRDRAEAHEREVCGEREPEGPKVMLIHGGRVHA